MADIIVAGNTSGSITISAPAVSGSNTLTLPVATDTLCGLAATQTLTNKTLTAPVLSGSLTGTYTLAGTPTITSPSISSAVMTTMASSVLTSGTAQASTSGTSIDFTGIPSWVKRITVMLSGVSVSGTSSILVQLGTSGGIQSTGYVSAGSVNHSGGTGSGTSTAGLMIFTDTATFVLSGNMIICNQSGSTWVSSHSTGATGAANGQSSGGGVKSSLASTLDRIRITTVNGTDTFDAGSVNILYE